MSEAHIPWQHLLWAFQRMYKGCPGSWCNFILSHNICINTYLLSSDIQWRGIFEYLLQCSEERINPGKLLGKSRRLKYHTRFQNTIGWWSTKSATVIAWSPSFSNKLSSSFHTTKGLRYGTVTGSGLGRRHSNPKDSVAPCKVVGRLPVGMSFCPPMSSLSKGP